MPTTKYPLALAPAEPIPGAQRRDWFSARFEEEPIANISAQEWDVHLLAMPLLYWEHVTESDLIWGLETIQAFLKLVASPERSATTPVLSWRQTKQTQCRSVMLCNWDRRSLAAKAAAAFTSVGLNLTKADLFTRSDQVVLDQFFVTDGRGAVTPERLEEARLLLEGALSEPPRFTAVWSGARPRFIPPRKGVTPRISLTNEAMSDSTLVQIEAADRFGLLCDILQVIADAGLNTQHAQAETEAGLARDRIYVTDGRGQKLSNDRLDWLQARLTAALTQTL